MSDFRTIIPSDKYPFSIDYQSKILFMGSCFSNNISQKLIDGGFSVTVNPFGVLYNPLSIKEAFDILIEQKQFTESDLIESHGLYHSFSHHGSFSDISKEKALEKTNHSVNSNLNLIQNTNVVFITFGTAYVYRYIKSQKIVSNCHKISAKEFEHFALNIDEIVLEYKILLKQLYSKNPNIKIVFTVSPVRHWKDGTHENQLSKSTLHLAIAQLQAEFNFVHYYPSYEIVMDDLRDYRFYAEDFIHINSQAVDYIYNHFQNSFYTSKTKNIEQKVHKLRQALNHRPFNPESKEHQKFIEKTKTKIIQLKQDFPEVKF